MPGEVLLPLPAPSPFLPGWRLREKAPGDGEIAVPAVLRYTPAPGHRGLAPPPSPSLSPTTPSPWAALWRPVRRVSLGVGRTWREAPLAVRGASRRLGPCGVGVLTSPPQRPRVQVPRAVPRRRGGSCGHAPAAGPSSRSGGSARAAAGAALSPAPLPPRAPGRRRARPRARNERGR